MALAESTLAAVDALLATAGTEGITAQLRAAAPGLRVTCCDESDVGVETPYRSYPSFHLHLVDGTQHCWVLTTDVAQATAILVAKRRGTR
jgi:hypothetical protein